MENPLPEPGLGQPVVLTRNLTKHFGARKAVQNLGIQVDQGELFGIVGPDGAGKTTILRMLAGILPPTSGDAWIDGVSVCTDPEGIKEHIAYMPQRFGLYQDLTVMENLLFYADLFQVPKKQRGPRIEQLFAFSRLGPFKDRAAGALSGGMKQKLGLTCALIHSPRLLLLDEPTNGVDPVSRRDFWKILYELLKQGITIVVSTAYLDEAERTGRVALMYEGSLIQLGPPLELKSMVEGVLVELVPSRIAPARTLVSGVPGVLEVNVFGDALHVRLERDECRQAVREHVERNGVEVLSLKRITPTMEDAFLSLIARHAHRERGQA